MKEQLKDIIVREKQALENLLKLLDEQHAMLVTNDIFGLEAITTRIQLCNKEVAEKEVERRKFIGGEAMSKIINSLADNELDNSYRSIKVKLQKDSNEMLIKQGLGFSTRMLNIINPDRNMKTYNSYGKYRK